MRYRQVASVQKRKYVEGSAGQRELENDGEPIPVRGNLHPLTAEEITLWGDSSLEIKKWFCRIWPGDIYCAVTIGSDAWDQVAPAKVFDLGSSTNHAEVILRKR